MQTVIIAGGEGTRIAPYVGDIPKSLIQLNRKTLLDFQLTWVGENNPVHFCLGFKNDMIISKLEKVTVNEISYSVDDQKYGVIGTLKYAKNYLNEEFCVLLGDTLPKYSFEYLLKKGYELSSGGYSVMYVAPAQQKPGQIGNVKKNRNEILSYCKSCYENHDYVDIGFWILKREHLDYITSNQMWEEDFFPKLIEASKLKVIEVSEGSWEVGSIEGLNDMRQHYSHSKIGNNL